MTFFRKPKAYAKTKCLAEIQADLTMMDLGYIPLHARQRTEAVLWPGERLSDPTVHVYFAPGGTAKPPFAIAKVMVHGIHPIEKPEDLELLSELSSVLDCRDETVEKIRAQGFTPVAISFDGSKKDPARALTIAGLT